MQIQHTTNWWQFPYFWRKQDFTYHVNCSFWRQLIEFITSWCIIYIAGWVTESVDADQKPCALWHLIWVYTVCSGLSVLTLGVTKVSIKGTALQTCLVSHYNNKRCFSCCCYFVYLILKVLFKVLHCNFNMLNLPMLDVLGLDVALGWNPIFFYWSIERKKCSGLLQNNTNTNTYFAMMWRDSGCFPFVLFTDWVLGWCESESPINHACLIILSYIAVYNHDTCAWSSESVSNVGMSFVMLITK